MKRFLLPLAAVALLAVSCGDSKDEKDSEGDDTTEAAADETSANATEGDISNAVTMCQDAFYDGLGENAAMFDMDKLEPIVDEYCDCAVNKLVEADIPVADLMTISQDEVMEVAGDCFTEFQSKMMEAVNMEAAMEEATEEASEEVIED